MKSATCWCIAVHGLSNFHNNRSTADVTPTNRTVSEDDFAINSQEIDTTPNGKPQCPWHVPKRTEQQFPDRITDNIAVSLVEKEIRKNGTIGRRSDAAKEPLQNQRDEQKCAIGSRILLNFALRQNHNVIVPHVGICCSRQMPTLRDTQQKLAGPSGQLWSETIFSMGDCLAQSWMWDVLRLSGTKVSPNPRPQNGDRTLNYTQIIGKRKKRQAMEMWLTSLSVPSRAPV